MKVQHIGFSGAILERGFWLYVWRIQGGSRFLYYVGRTGDSSSQYAASPFSRLGQHLDARKNATANMVLRHVRKLSIDPLSCQYDLIALGPIFPEQATLELHREYRDRIAPLEEALADHIRSKGLEVLGRHSNNGAADPELLSEITSAFDQAMENFFRAGK